jgi:phosphatidylglycerol lysyltransferase
MTDRADAGREIRRLARGLPLLLLAAAVWAVSKEARHLRWAAVRAAVRALPASHLAVALVLTAVSFALLTGYDVIGLVFARHRLPYRRTAFASFIAFAVSQSLGFPLITGLPIRYRLYSAWGLDPSEVRDVLASYVTTFWVGCVGMTGVVLLAEPRRLLPMLHLPAGGGRPLGVILAASAVAYVVWAAKRDRSFRLMGLEVRAPGPEIALAQVLLGALDWSVAAAVLYMLLPPTANAVPFPTFVGVFLLAQVAGLVSHVPGGIGVFEAMMLALLPADIGTGAVLASLLVYRAVYYLLPLVVALLGLASYEAWARRSHIERASSIVVRGVSLVVPPTTALAVFVAGLVLLFSGAVPAAGERLEALRRFEPLVLVELSHFLASLVGGALLVLAWAIQHRLKVAYHLTLGLLLAAAVLSLMKGLDYEEASIMLAMAIALFASGGEFYRVSSLLAEPWTGGWGLAVLGSFVAVVGFGVIAHERPDLASDVWWRFAWDAEAPRSLRGTVGALALIGGFALVKLFSPAAPRLEAPTERDLEDAEALARAAPRTYAQLVLLRDKQVLLDEARSAFLMYAVQGRSWVAMGDPVGEDAACEELAWRFRELAHVHADWAVFYQVVPSRLPVYVDLGLTITKLGEEARIPLAEFSLEGGRRKDLRRTIRTVEKAGGTFRILSGAEVSAALPQLRTISDDWLARKGMREKRFSLGYFDESYLTSMSVAVVELGGQPVAFANLQQGAELHEAAIDLMRYGPDSPPDSMEYLLTRCILWAQSCGFEWFSLGMAPLSGLEARPLAPLWAHLGAALYRYGDHFYHFGGLRAYKASFDPVWEPRYLASPGGAALPRVLTNVATLISGGIGGVVRR